MKYKKSGKIKYMLLRVISICKKKTMYKRKGMINIKFRVIIAWFVEAGME